MSTQAEQARSEQTTLAGEIVLLLLLSLIWGSSFTLIKVAIPSIPPFTMVAVRVTLAAILLLLIATAQGHSLPRQPPIWAAFFLQGLLQSALPFTLISWGEAHIASGLAGVLNATPPMFVLAISLMTGHGRKAHRSAAGTTPKWTSTARFAPCRISGWRHAPRASASAGSASSRRRR